jgi:hypothetical protein
MLHCSYTCSRTPAEIENASTWKEVPENKDSAGNAGSAFAWIPLASKNWRQSWTTFGPDYNPTSLDFTGINQLVRAAYRMYRDAKR